MVFVVAVTNHSARCRNCGKDIPSNTPKLRFLKAMGAASVNQSLCINCLTDMLAEEGFLLFTKESVICRSCDIVMKYEEENPKGYHLFKCFGCGSRVGIEVKRSPLK